MKCGHPFTNRSDLRFSRFIDQTRRQFPDTALILRKHEPHRGMRQRRECQEMLDVAALGFRRPQKFTAGR